MRHNGAPRTGARHHVVQEERWQVGTRGQADRRRPVLICGVVALPASPLGLLLSGAGVLTLVTGVFGYCPACAIVQREPLKG
jgi:hypothetical protein